MKVIDIDVLIHKDPNKPIIVIPIDDCQRIKTIYGIDGDLMKVFGVEERNSHTITQLEPEADEDDEDYDDSEQDMQYDEDDEDDEDSEQKVHYYAIEKDCCCGLLRLSEKPLVYLYIKPRFPLDICSMLKQVDKFHPLWEKCLRKPKIDLVYEGVPEEYRKKLWDSDGNELGTESKDTPCCAVSMSVLFELYAWTMIKKNYYCETGWQVVDKNATLMPSSAMTFECFIPDLQKEAFILQMDGKKYLLKKTENEPKYLDVKCQIQPLGYKECFIYSEGRKINGVVAKNGDDCFVLDAKYKDGAQNIFLPTRFDTYKEYKYYIAGEVNPDIVLEKGGKYIILDVKYKDCDVPNRDDRLQLLAYADVYDAHVIGHIFPDKGNGCTFRSSQLNTKLGDNYHYLQFCLDDSGNVPRKLNDKIKEVIEGAGLM